MPQDYYCDKCDYGITIGWHHYRSTNIEGFGGRVQFVCSTCFTTHSKELGRGKERFLYQMKKLKIDEEWDRPREQEKGIVSADEEFACPVCSGTEMITDKDILQGGETVLTCPDCHDKMRYLGTWGT